MPAEPVAQLDIARYLGRWYVIARTPATGPRALGAFFEYRADGDDRIADVYVTREDALDGEAVTRERTARFDPRHPARWEVSTGWFGSDEQWVLYVSDDYRYAIAGSPSQAEAWILAREPVIPEWTYAGLIARLALQGYDVAKFRRVAQKPEQVGKAGFE